MKYISTHIGNRQSVFVANLLLASLPALALLSPFFCSAQKNISRSNEQWTHYYSHVQLPKKMVLSTDVSLRMAGGFHKTAATTFRTGIGYPLTAKLRGFTGMAFFNAYKPGLPNRLEFRPFQDVFGVQKIGKTALQHRFRIEARYFWQLAGQQSPAASDFNFRLRYRMFWVIPLGLPARGGKGSRLLFNIGDEIMLNAGKSGKHNLLNANRFLLGPAFRFNENLSLALTYNFQFAQRGVPHEFQHTDILWIGLTHNMGRKTVKAKP